jgi:ceramide glucosyltransferase
LNDAITNEGGIFHVSTLLHYLVLLPALGPLVYYFLAIYSGWNYFRKRPERLSPPKSNQIPAVSILKPVRGVDHEAYENFASMCQLDYPEYEIVFGVSDADDPVIPLLQKLQAEFPETSIRVIVGIKQLGSSHKTNTLCRIALEAKHSLLVINDSDVRVEKDYLKQILASFSDPKVGLVTALFRGKAGDGFAERLDAIGVPTDSAASMLLQRRFSEIDFAYGWTMAVAKERLAEIGGFEAMVNFHSDDFVLGHEIAKRGYRIELMRTPVCMVFPKETLRQFLMHELRWNVQSRNSRPMGYLAMFMTFGFAWLLLVGLLGPSWKAASAYLVAYLTLRCALAWVVGVWGLRDSVVKHNLWLVPVRDAVNLCVYVASFFCNVTQWRGQRYRVSGPSMVPLPDAR